MIRVPNIRALALIACASAAANAAAPSLDLSRVPGTVIAHYPKSAGQYVGSPG
jgi:hypothetical protein